MPTEISFDEKPTLIGERVVLRPVCAADASAAVAVDPEADRLTGTHETFSLEALERWYGSRAEHSDRLDLAIVDRPTGVCVGEVVLSDLDVRNRSCSFRISLFDRRSFGQGLGTEAIRLILEHAFGTVGVHRIELSVFAFNPRARHVYEKLGFVHEGTRRDALHWDGEWIDGHTMAILADEWAARRGHPYPTN
ncbi:GNAT family N-acetyltransferase [Kitasatospora purpeofusca]|uniref:GNAT family N-acetyltransferase n=1 Tax=Kitasatospora purpeofusca TaxID=67352 RepID=UPI0036E7EF0A